MGEVLLEASAEIIESRLTVGGADDAVLRTLTPATCEVGPLAAILRQRFIFGITEFHLRSGKRKRVERGVREVAQTVLGIHGVVAEIDAAVTLSQGECAPGKGLPERILAMLSRM